MPRAARVHVVHTTRRLEEAVVANGYIVQRLPPRPPALQVIQRRQLATRQLSDDTPGPLTFVEPPINIANREATGSTRRRSAKLPKITGGSGTLQRLAAKETIISSLECPVCYNIPIPPIAQCKGGHITCGPCRTKLHCCGLCKKSFSTSRNYPVEAIINSCYFNCPYEEDGCNGQIKGEVYGHHTNTCDFRNIICTEGRREACNFVSVPYRKYWHHLKDVHELKSKVVLLDDFTCIDLAIPTAFTHSSGTVNDKFCFEIANTNHKFLLRVIHTNDSFKFWISYFGETQEGLNFKATLCVGSVGGNESKVTWKMSVCSFRKEFGELEEVGTVMDSYMKKIAKQVVNGVYTVLLFCKFENLNL